MGRTLMKIRPLCVSGVLGAALLTLTGCGGKTGIQIVSATYGASCGAPPGNATADLKDKCEGQMTCDYAVNVSVIGDPKQGCKKEYEAKWTCGSDSVVHTATIPAEAGFGQHVQFSCVS